MCIVCKKKLPIRKNKRGSGLKFCSHECRKSYNTRKAKEYRQRFLDERKLNTSWWQTTKFKCKSQKCDKLFFPNRIYQKFCSIICREKDYKKDFIKENVKDLQELYKNFKVPWLKIRITVLDRDGFKCCYCGRSPQIEEGVILHIDHKIPKERGGSDSYDNLITACQECNLGKNDYLLETWKKQKNENHS